MANKNPVQQVMSPSGEPAWLVSGYEQVKALLADPRLSRTHADPRHPVRLTQPALFGGPIGDPASERADHVRMRRLLTRSFSARRMESLRPRLAVIVEQVLADLRAAGAPADFHATVSFPLPALVMCEVLGVPDPDRADFLRWCGDATHMDHPARSRAGLQSLWRYLGALIERKHHALGEDVISDLIAGGRSDPSLALSDDGVAHLASGLLFAGHASTSAVIDKGVALLATHPGARQALAADPGLARRAVEEILRSASPLDRAAAGRRGGLPRYAAEPIAVDEARIPAGGLVMFALQDANEDQSVFPEPARFDIAREENPHLSFSHGQHFCLGATVARMELQLLFGRLLAVFPGLALAEPLPRLQALRAQVPPGHPPPPLPVTW